MYTEYLTENRNSMNNTYIENGYIICKALGDAVNKKVNTVEKCKSEDDLKCRLRFLKAHNLLTFLSFVVDKEDISFYLGEEKCRELESKVNKAVFKQLKVELMSDTISEKLSNSDVNHLILKGTTLKKYYPKNIVRTSTDIDIYVDESDVALADVALKNLGFSFEQLYKESDYKYVKSPRYNVEVHTLMEGFTDTQKKVLKDLAESTFKTDEKAHRLSDNDTYIHLVFHLYKHFVNSGAGVRMLLDLYLMRKNADLDFSYIKDVLQKLGVDGFEEVMSRICLVLFENEEADEDVKDVIAFIFDSGAFGKVSNLWHLSKINEKQTNETKSQLLSSAYGLDLDAMKVRYPILIKYPVLYPFSFIHRFFYGIIHRRDVLKNAAKAQKNISSDRVDEYRKIFITARIHEDNKK